MNDPLLKTRHVPADARARVAAQLASWYAEVADLADPEVPFSLARLLLAHAGGVAPTGREAEVVGAAALLMGQHADPHRAWIPLRALATRSMASTPGPKGGYASGVETAATPVDVLRPWSVVASSGAMVLPGLLENVVLPRTTAATTAAWFGETGAAPSETPPTLGNVSLAVKQAMAFVKFSMQLLRQGEAVEEYIRAQLLAAVGELLDRAFFAGAGGVEPLGLLTTSGVGAQSGASLAHAGVLAMRRQVLAAGGREASLQWVGTPQVQELLGARERATGGGRFLWDADGVLGKPASATKNAPANALVCGDFSQATVGIFGPGVRIDIDPSQDFNSAGLVARVLLMVDVAFAQPSAFCVATSVT
jgi:HK97 family phage major capsid protein